MAAYGPDDDLPTINLSKVQTIFLPQIERAVASMHHIDELFQWLANMLAHYFNIPLLLTWANRSDQYGQSMAQLRTIARQDLSFPEQIIVNDQTQLIAQQLIVKRLTHKPQPLETLFSHYQTVLLKRYGLHYWGACFVSKNALLPARGDVFTYEGSPAFLALVTLFFFRQMPPANIVQSMDFVLDKAMEAALARGLLLPPVEAQTPFPFSEPFTPFPAPELMQPIRELRPQLTQLVPERKQDASLMLSENPFSQAAVIADKKARKLHQAINGHDSVAALCSATGMSMQEVSTALRLLWEQDRIVVRGPDSQPVDLLLFLNDR